jgi:hypothetical protein
MDDDVRDKADVNGKHKAADVAGTSMLDLETTPGMLSDIDSALWWGTDLDTLSGDEEDTTVKTNIFCGVEGHELFINLLIEADDEFAMPGLDSIIA